MRSWLTPLNLHWAGVGLLALVNVYLIAQMVFLWHRSSNYNADAMAQQRAALNGPRVRCSLCAGWMRSWRVRRRRRTGSISERLPASDSEVAGELGRADEEDGRAADRRCSYMHVPVLPGSSGGVDRAAYRREAERGLRPLVLFLNSLERDQMFFVINGVTLTGQQTGTVNLRLRLTTYQRGGVPPEPDAGVSLRALPAGGQGR